MLWSTGWSSQRAYKYRRALPANLFSPGILPELAHVAVRLTENGRMGLSIETCADWRQSAFLLRNEHRGQAVLGFDLLQSLALKTMAINLAERESYVSTANLLRTCAAIAIHEVMPSHAATLRAVSFPSPGSHYPSDEADREKLRPIFEQIVEPLDSDLFLHLIDVYVLAHEFYHFIEYAYPDQARVYAAEAAVAFAAAVEEVCVENRPDFEEIVSYYGAVKLDKTFLEHKRQQMKVWRSHFNANASRIQGEIAADSFAFATLAYEVTAGKRIPLVSGYNTCVHFSYLIHVIWDLHRAMIHRGLLSIGAPVIGLKSGDTGESNLRKVALVSFAVQYPKHAYSSKVNQDPSFQSLLQSYAQGLAIWPTKATLDALIVVPVAKAVYDMLEIAKNAKQCHRSSPEVPEWLELEKVFGRRAVEHVFSRHNA